MIDFRLLKQGDVKIERGPEAVIEVDGIILLQLRVSNWRGGLCAMRPYGGEFIYFCDALPIDESTKIEFPGYCIFICDLGLGGIVKIALVRQELVQGETKWF